MSYLYAELSDRLERGLCETRRRGESLAQPCVWLTPLLQIYVPHVAATTR
ncbi:hypothetical protein GCM10023317_93480 [Actinopolymorpha pittospori]